MSGVKGVRPSPRSALNFLANREFASLIQKMCAGVPPSNLFVGNRLVPVLNLEPYLGEFTGSEQAVTAPGS